MEANVFQHARQRERSREQGRGRQAAPAFRFRPPQVDDGPAMWRLVRESTLDDNSVYAYLMLPHYYAGTCTVVDHGGELAGFVTGFLPPEQPDTLFVWQVGVCEWARGNGLATRMIVDVLRRERCEEVRFVEATVTPSNRASLALFRGLAAKLETRCREREVFPGHLFPGEGHEPEWLLRIGPFTPRRLDTLSP